MSLKDLKLSAFEKAVLRTVASIPLGATRSYKWVARKAGSPKAVRAVGSILHKNPFAPTVPCHRVVASDGSLGGYRGGEKKKMALLKKEKEIRLLLSKKTDAMKKKTIGIRKRGQSE